jgi:hypothetical protein
MQGDFRADIVWLLPYMRLVVETQSLRALIDMRALPLLLNTTAFKARGRKQGLGKPV